MGTRWRGTLNHNVIIGYTDRETAKLNFDDTPFRTVKYWAERTCNWFKLGFIIKSSHRSYHVVFDREVTWKKNIHIMNWVAIESQIPKLKDYCFFC